jgi:chaperonin cofactor prefoldin
LESILSQEKQNENRLMSILNSDLVELKNVKQNQSLQIENDEKLIQKLQAQIETMSQDKQALTKQIKECDRVKKLELENLKRHFTDNECAIKRLTEQNQNLCEENQRLIDEKNAISKDLLKSNSYLREDFDNHITSKSYLKIFLEIAI